MKQNSMPDNKRQCPHCKEWSLNYYHEGNNGNDLYYCSSCYGISIWDGLEVKSTEGEAYPNRDKLTNPAKCKGCNKVSCECGKTANEPYSGFDAVA